MKLKLLILSLLLIVHSGFAQISQYDFKNITIKDGLSQSSVYSIYQDGKGFMWFGTFDGLNRYDGRTMKVYLPNAMGDSTRALSNGTIRGLDGDKHGKIFIATYGGGLNVFNLNTDKIKYFISTDSMSIMDDYLTDILYVNDSTVWIASAKGVSSFNPINETFHNYPFNLESTRQAVMVSAFSLFIDSKNDLWVGTYGNGLFKLNQDDGSYKHYRNKNSSNKFFDQNLIRSISDYRDGLLLVATSDGLFVFNPHTGDFNPYGMHGIKAVDIIKDEDGFWVTSSYSGLRYFDKDGNKTDFVHNPYNQKSFIDNRLIVGYRDNIGNVWVGTRNEGVIMINRNRKPFTYIYNVANRPSIPDNSIFALAEDYAGRVWVGTEKGLSVWNRKDNSFKTIGLQYKGELEYNMPVWGLVLDDNNDLWIATSNGVFVFNVKSGKQQHYYKLDGESSGILNNNIDCLGRGKSSIWIATANGLCRLNLKNKLFANYFADGAANSISNAIVRQIYRDSKGHLWFCTLNGLSLYNEESDDFKVFRFDKDGVDFMSSEISSIHEAEDGKLWLTTSKGISVFDYDSGKIIKNIGENDGLPKGYIYRLIESGNNMWASSNNGLVVIDKKTYNVLINYQEEDGLQSNEFNPAAIKLSDGYVLFGGINGITGFYPDSIHKSDFVPSLYFIGLSVLGQEISMSDTIMSEQIIFKKSIISASKIIFYPDEKMFSIRFAALDYSNAERVQYYYRMLPASSKWVSLGERDFVTFINLNPGEYQLQVKSTNANGILCDNIKSIKIVVEPSFFQKRWVMWLGVMLLIISVFLIYKYRTYRLIRDKKKLEAEVEKRTREIARQKERLEHFAANLEEKVNQRTKELKLAKQNAEESDRLKSAFLSNMSHEIRTPMNAILGFSELLSSPGFDAEERLSFARMVKTNGDALLTLLNDIIDISMIESGQLKLNIVDVNVLNLVNNVFLMFNNSGQLIEKPEVSLDLNIIDDRDILIKTDSQRLLQILNNLVGNALKFTDNGFVEFGYEIEKESVRFFVKDTGIGISEESLQRVFDRFHKLNIESKSIYGGNGLGLTITKNLVEALNGEIWVESKEGSGTTFYFTLPL